MSVIIKIYLMTNLFVTAEVYLHFSPQSSRFSLKYCRVVIFFSHYSFKLQTLNSLRLVFWIYDQSVHYSITYTLFHFCPTAAKWIVFFFFRLFLLFYPLSSLDFFYHHTPAHLFVFANFNKLVFNVSGNFHLSFNLLAFYQSSWSRIFMWEKTSSLEVFCSSLFHCFIFLCPIS